MKCLIYTRGVERAGFETAFTTAGDFGAARIAANAVVRLLAEGNVTGGNDGAR